MTSAALSEATRSAIRDAPSGTLLSTRYDQVQLTLT